MCHKYDYFRLLVFVFIESILLLDLFLRLRRVNCDICHAAKSRRSFSLLVNFYALNMQTVCHRLFQFSLSSAECQKYASQKKTKLQKYTIKMGQNLWLAQFGTWKRRLESNSLISHLSLCALIASAENNSMHFMPAPSNYFHDEQIGIPSAGVTTTKYMPHFPMAIKTICIFRICIHRHRIAVKLLPRRISFGCHHTIRRNYHRNQMAWIQDSNVSHIFSASARLI